MIRALAMSGNAFGATWPTFFRKRFGLIW